MSHITTIKTEIRDLDALKAACKELGFTFKENQKTYRWWGSEFPDSSFTQEALASPPEGMTADELGTCHHAISFPKGFLGGGVKLEMGLRRTATGYRVVCDDVVMMDEDSPVGKDACKLMQLYATHKATMEAHRHGLMVNRVEAANGAIQLVVTGNL